MATREKIHEVALDHYDAVVEPLREAYETAKKKLAKAEKVLEKARREDRRAMKEEELADEVGAIPSQEYLDMWQKIHDAFDAAMEAYEVAEAEKDKALDAYMLGERLAYHGYEAARTSEF